MKKIIYTFFILCNVFVFGQKTTFIKYNVSIANEDIFKDNEYLRGSFDKAIKESKSLKFGLICKNNNSFFYNIEQLSTEEGFNSNKTTLIFANYMGEIYQEKDSLLAFSSLLGNKTYIKKAISKNWILQNETKIIDGYKCYKATSEYVVINSVGEFRHPVIAWYCPEIPLPFGPNGYGGLPGLILQLQVRNVTFGVENIDFNSDENFEINKKSMKILSEEEYKKALNKFNGFDSK